MIRGGSQPGGVEVSGAGLSEWAEIHDASMCFAWARLGFFAHLLVGLEGERFKPRLPSLVRLFQGRIDVAEMIVNGRIRFFREFGCLKDVLEGGLGLVLFEEDPPEAVEIGGHFWARA